MLAKLPLSINVWGGASTLRYIYLGFGQMDRPTRKLGKVALLQIWILDMWKPCKW